MDRQRSLAIQYPRNNCGSALSLSNSFQQVKNNSSLIALTTNTSNVNINAVVLANAPAGLHSKSITLQIVAN